MPAGRLAARRGGYVVPALVAFGVGCLLVAAVLGLHNGTRADGRGRVAAAVHAVDRGELPADVATTPASIPARPVGRISRLRLARLGVDAPVVPVSAPGGVMQIPQDPGVVGWWSSGARPGSPRGNVVIVGHVDFHGVTGALAALPDTRPGDAVVVAGSTASLRYVVRAIRVYPKATGLPPAIFARDGPQQLVLITCGGPFDPSTGNYEDNIVAFASPIR
jgi:hypothetical protein